MKAILALAALWSLAGPRLAAAQSEETWSSLSPVASEEVTPLSPSTEPVAEADPVEGWPPEAHPVDEETWKAMKLAAETDPNAPAPDEVLVEAQTSAPLAGFPGIGWDRINPADVSLAKSPNRILEAVNSNLLLLDGAGNTLAGTSLTAFFGGAFPERPPFDPRVIYDRAGVNPRFYIVASQWIPPNEGGPHARIWLAVSRSPNPTGLGSGQWCVYSLNALDDFDSVPEPVWPDQPNVGVGAEVLMVTSNQHTMATLTFTFALARAFRKAELSNNASGCTSARSYVFRPSNVRNDLSTFGLQPVNHSTYPSSFAGASNPAYAVSSRLGSDSKYWVWRVINIHLATNQLQRAVVDANVIYGVPPDAPQPTLTNVKIDTGDSRVTQAVGVGNSLWFTHGTFCQSGGFPDESCFRTVKVDVGQSTAGAPTATLREHKVVGGGANVFYSFPALAVNSAGRMVVTFLRSSVTSYLGSLWAAKNANQGTFGAAGTLTPGTCPRPAQTCDQFGNCFAQAGDYLGAQVDPVDFTSFWVAGERSTIYPPGSTSCSWDTTILRVN